ncbi:MAG: sugar ABC transporter ATP-binding protein [Anaerolineae bacterium]
MPEGMRGVGLASSTPADILSIQKLSKSFPGTRALDSASLTLRRGEIHALLGENGAGKSTLIKILAGVYRADGGEIRWNGQLVDLARTKLPLAFIHQDLGLVDGSGPPAILPSLSLTVAENIALVAGYGGGLISWRGIEERAAEVLKAVGSTIDPRTQVSALTSAEKSVVAIARALAVKADVLVLDEPTASLPESDVSRLFEVIEALADSGMAMIYVTHRLDEVFRIAHRVTVLRDGRTVAITDAKDTSPRDLIEKITGRSVAEFGLHKSPVSTESMLQVSDLFVEANGPISFDVRRGEIVGLAGLRGAGHELVGRVLFGDLPHTSGMIRLNGQPYRAKSVAHAIKAGIGLLSSKRVEECVLAGLTVRENIFPNPLMAGGVTQVVGGRRERAQSEVVMERYDVRPRDGEHIINTLSGGNQQKAMLARWMETGSELLILEEPTAGVDVGARADIYAILQQAVDSHKSILLISSDFQEAARICNRCFVFDRGRVVAELSGRQLTNQNLIAFASAKAEGARMKETEA